MSMMSIAEALRSAIADEMRRDETVFCLGEDVCDLEGGYGGAFAVTKNLAKEFGADRVLNTPISEILITGAAVGAAMAGMRPIADLQYGDFLFCCMDQLANQAAKMCYMSGGKVKVPMVMRAPVGATNRGAQHAQSLEGFFTRIPGLKVVSPSTAYDAKGLLKAAIRDDNPVLVFEHKLLYGKTGTRVETGGINPMSEIPEGDDYVIPFGEAAVRREGTDVTIVGNLLMAHRALEAAGLLEKEGVSCEVIDPRSLVPFDYQAVVRSLEKTSHLVIAHEDSYSNGWGAQLSAWVAEHALYLLDAPVQRVATPDVPIPFAPVLENFVVPSTERIVEAVRAVLKD